MFLMATLSGCASVECDQYRHLLSDDSARKEVVGWANENFFENEILSSDIIPGGLVGPGKWRVRPDGRLSSLPKSLNSIIGSIADLPLDVRLLGSDHLHPDAIFIGRKSFRGLLISKSGMQSTLKELEFSDRDIIASENRLAILCYQEP